MKTKFSLNEFISAEMFTSLVGCTLIVCGCVELLKQYVPLNPLFLNLIVANIVTAVRIVIIGDFSFKGIIIGLFNLIPIMLGATGTYEFLKNILGG